MKLFWIFLSPLLVFGATPNISISPTAASTPYTLRLMLTAKITGKGSEQGVMWSTSAGSITPIPGGTSASFFSPGGCGVAVVVAIAKANPKQTATAKITVTADKKITIQPSSATLVIPKAPAADAVPQKIRFTATGPCPGTF